MKIVFRQISSDFGLWDGFGISLTNRCNLSCGYCSRSCGPANDEVVPLTTVKSIIDLFKKNSRGRVRTIQLTGGEIFLYKHIDEVVQYALDSGFICHLQTNGVLIPKFVSRRPKLYGDARVAFKISLDGWDSETNGLYRGNSFHLIVEGIKAALSVNKLVGIKTVFHDQNLNDVKKILDLCLMLGVKGWSYNLLRSCGRSIQNPNINELDVVKKVIPILKREKYVRLLNGTSIQFYLLLHAAGKLALPAYYFVNSDGGVYLTDKLVQERRLGNVFDGPLSKQFNVGNKLPINDLTINPDVLQYILSHLKVEIERRVA